GNDQLWRTRGLGTALRRKIEQGLRIRRESAGARHMHRAEQLLAAAQASLLRSNPDLKEVIIAGDARRGTELVSDLSLVAVAARRDDGPTVHQSGDLTVHLTDGKHRGISLLRATGSATHLEQLAALAQ